MIRVRVVKRFNVDLSIDGHDAIGVVLRITGGLQPFRLVVISANLGRGYSAVKFKRNVMRILDRVDERQYVILLLQEIDETDPAEEHVLLERWMEPGTTLAGWSTREPIAVSPDVKVTRRRRTLLMRQGTMIGAPVGTGPDRYLVTCIATIEGVKIGLGNQHPHRDLPNAKVQRARRRGERVTSRVLAELAEVCDLVVDGGDFNDHHPPKAHPRQRTIHSRGLDHIRLIRSAS